MPVSTRWIALKRAGTLEWLSDGTPSLERRHSLDGPDVLYHY
jgi:hypothetical protein